MDQRVAALRRLGQGLRLEEVAGDPAAMRGRLARCPLEIEADDLVAMHREVGGQLPTEAAGGTDDQDTHRIISLPTHPGAPG